MLISASSPHDPDPAGASTRPPEAMRPPVVMPDRSQAPVCSVTPPVCALSHRGPEDDSADMLHEQHKVAHATHISWLNAPLNDQGGDAAGCAIIEPEPDKPWRAGWLG